MACSKLHVGRRLLRLGIVGHGRRVGRGGRRDIRRGRSAGSHELGRPEEPAVNARPLLVPANLSGLKTRGRNVRIE